MSREEQRGGGLGRGMGRESPAGAPARERREIRRSTGACHAWPARWMRRAHGAHRVEQGRRAARGEVGPEGCGGATRREESGGRAVGAAEWPAMSGERRCSARQREEEGEGKTGTRL